MLRLWCDPHALPVWLVELNWSFTFSTRPKPARNVPSAALSLAFFRVSLVLNGRRLVLTAGLEPVRVTAVAAPTSRPSLVLLTATVEPLALWQPTQNQS